MRCNLWLVSCVVIVSIWIGATPTAAAQDERSVLLMYYGNDDATYSNTIFLDATLTGIFTNVSVQSVYETTSQQLQQTDIVILYSQTQVPMQVESMEYLATYDGELFVIGPAAMQLPQFEEWTFDGVAEVRSVEGQPLSYSMEVPRIIAAPHATVYASGYHFGTAYPLILQQRNIRYSGISQFYENEKYVFTASLYELFNIPAPITHPAYIRLEDVSPAADPQLVQETADYLLNRHIPVYIALIPVFLDPQTGETTTLKDVPKLQAVLDDLVARGAMIIAHGYTHTYRDDETGEGFEFWDSLYNQPITTVDSQQEPTRLAQPDTFTNEAAYEAYMEPFREIERQYIEHKLESSIHILTDLDYLPVAFEAPHYTMSRNGYAVTSTYFNALFGQLQASEKDWRRMMSPLLISKPDILGGMTLYPETIGFIDETLPNPLKEMEQKIEAVTTVPGATLGAFYHPYLGTDYLEEMVALMESVPNIEWIHVAQEGVHVQTPFVSITSDNGTLQLEDNRTWTYYMKQQWAQNPGEFILWGIVIITAIFVLLFFVHIATMRIRYRKRLFEERM